MEYFNMLFESLPFVWKVIIFIFLAIVVIFFAFVCFYFYLEKKYRKHIPNATDLLVVMNSERWDTKRKICTLVNTKLENNVMDSFFGWNAYFLGMDLFSLKDDGFVEMRRIYYDKETGKECPHVRNEDVVWKDGKEGYVYDPRYISRIEYRKTSKGAKIKHWRSFTSKRREGEQSGVFGF